MREHMSLMTAYWYGFLGGTMFCVAIWRITVMMQVRRERRARTDGQSLRTP